MDRQIRRGDWIITADWRTAGSVVDKQLISLPHVITAHANNGEAAMSYALERLCSVDV